MRVVVALALLLLAACADAGGGADDVRIELAIEPAPPTVGPVSVRLSLRGPDGQPVTGAAVEVEGTMSHAGMVPVFGTAREREPGVYVAPLELTMGGDWILIVEADLADGRRLERNLEVRDVRWKRDS